MESNFQRSLTAVLKHEGGYVDHPADPGGATNMGITFAVLQAWRGKPITKADVQNLSLAEASQIYKAKYWNKVRGDDLPFGVDFAVFDFAVNSGPSRAAIFLQEIIGAAPDGKIGPLTLQAVQTWSAVKLIEALCGKRMEFLKKLSTWPTFGKGWSRRVTEVLRLAKDMAIALPNVPQPAPKPIPTPAKPKPRTVKDWLASIFVRQAAGVVTSKLKETGMSSNAVHNILNIAIAIIAVLSVPEVVALLPPELAVSIAGVLATAKVVINVVRDGLSGLWKEQPPVR